MNWVYSFIKECGIKYDPPSPRIIGGENVITHSWPFAVLIRQRYKNIVTLNGKIYLVKNFTFFYQIFFLICKKKRFHHHGYVEEH